LPNLPFEYSGIVNAATSSKAILLFGEILWQTVVNSIQKDKCFLSIKTIQEL
jgi:hypothetical protein